MKQGNVDKRIVKYLLLAAVLVLAVTRFSVLLEFVSKLWGIVFPLVLGGIMAYILNIIMRKLEKWYFPKSQNKLIKKTKRIVCIFLSFFLIVLIIFLVFRLVIPELINTIAMIGHWIPIELEKLQEFLADHADQIPELEKWINSLSFDWEATAQKLLQYLTSGVGGILGSTLSLVGTIGVGVTNFVIGLIFAIYILANKEKLKRQILRVARAYCKPVLVDKALGVLKVANDTFSSFIVGQCTEAVILGTLCIIGMKICQFPYAPMIGTFVGATALIPVVGAYLGGAVGFLMILTVSPVKAVLFVVFLVVLQQLEGNIIYPRVVGSSIGLPGMWVLAAVTIGGGLGGVGGMLLGVPTAATVYKLLRIDVNRRTPEKATDGDKEIETEETETRGIETEEKETESIQTEGLETEGSGATDE